MRNRVFEYLKNRSRIECSQHDIIVARPFICPPSHPLTLHAERSRSTLTRSLIRRSFSVVGLSFLLFSLSLAGQIPNDRLTLESDRKQLLAEIKANNEKLESVKVDKASKEEQLFLLQSQTRKRERLIATLEQEIVHAETGIGRVDEVVYLLSQDLGVLQEEYAKVLRAALRHKLNGSWGIFLFSARNFNEAYRRWQYFRQYDRYRKRQSVLISQTQQTLTEKKNLLAAAKTEKEGLLASAQAQQAALAAELGKIATLVADLRKNESQLLSEIQKQQRAHEQMNVAIENVILEETKRRKTEAKNPAGVIARPPAPATAAAGGFLPAHRGKLPWPVTNGVIVKPFGKQSHPTLRQVVIANNGIDIRAAEGAPVTAVFPGKVAGTVAIPRYRNAVIIQHGDYYTVYSNLDVLDCKNNDEIKAGQTLGRLAADDPDLHFELWHEKEHLNPALWLQKQ